MGWHKVDIPKPHKCEKPYYVDEGITTGDVIRCDDCGKLWKCTGADHGMQWDPYPRGVLKWEEVKP